jgi:hypothetical protein
VKLTHIATRGEWREPARHLFVYCLVILATLDFEITKGNDLMDTHESMLGLRQT